MPKPSIGSLPLNPAPSSLPPHAKHQGPISLYVHLPFCQSKCLYCDFPSFAGEEQRMAAYVAALCDEIRAWPAWPVHTLFLGGGTPTYLPIELMEALMASLFGHFHFLPGYEATLEANPGAESLHDANAPLAWARLRATGLNRVSMGVQSFDDQLLRRLGRIHTSADVARAVHAARAGGFERLSLDLMFGLPGQTLSDWQSSLEAAIALDPDHISAYALIVEPDTPFEVLDRKGRLKLPSEGQERAMYEWAEARLAQSGHAQYEISNFAKPGEACRHNLSYWRMGPWLGLGSSSASHLFGRRWANEADLAAYLRQGPSPVPLAPMPAHEAEGETMMMGLRLTQEGVSEHHFARRHGRSLAEAFGPVLHRLQEQALLENFEGTDGPAWRLSPLGRHLGNEAFAAFL